MWDVVWYITEQILKICTGSSQNGSDPVPWNAGVYSTRKVPESIVLGTDIVRVSGSRYSTVPLDRISACALGSRWRGKVTARHSRKWWDIHLLARATPA